MNAEEIAKGFSDHPAAIGELARALLVAIEALEQIEAIGDPMECADIAREARAKIRGESP